MLFNENVLYTVDQAVKQLRDADYSATVAEIEELIEGGELKAQPAGRDGKPHIIASSLNGYVERIDKEAQAERDRKAAEKDDARIKRENRIFKNRTNEDLIRFEIEKIQSAREKAQYAADKKQAIANLKKRGVLK